jgi:hypothetical protein
MKPLTDAEVDKLFAAALAGSPQLDDELRPVMVEARI